MLLLLLVVLAHHSFYLTRAKVRERALYLKSKDTFTKLISFYLFICSENMVSDRIPDRKVANIAASLVAAAASANGSIDEKERELNEVITGLQILREELIRRVSGHIT